MSYEYIAASKILDEASPLVTQSQLLLVCKEIDEDTPAEYIAAFIESANDLFCSVIDGYGIPLSLVTQIEKFLAAHFAATVYPTVSRQGLGPLSETFAVKGGTGLESTRYGQNAVGLDPTGELKKFSDGKGQKTVRMTSIGSGIIQLENV